MKSDEALFDLLCRNRMISSETMAAVKRFAQKWQLSAFCALCETRVVTEEELAQSIAKHLDLSIVRFPQDETVDEGVFVYIPYQEARRLIALPLVRFADQLKVVLANPMDADIVKQLNEISGLEVEPVVGIRYQIMQAIGELYPESLQIAFDAQGMTSDSA